MLRAHSAQASLPSQKNPHLYHNKTINTYTNTNYSTPGPTPAPTIRLIQATPSASGSTDPNVSITATATSSSATPSVPVGGWNAPPAEHVQPKDVGAGGTKKKVLQPKRSKLFSRDRDQDRTEKERGRDLSDVVRRVGAGSTSSLNVLSRASGSTSTVNLLNTVQGGRGEEQHGRETSLSLARKGFEIYVDPHAEEEDMEVVVVRKTKSRAALRGVFGDAEGEAVLRDRTNGQGQGQGAPALPKEGKEEKEGSGRWWGLGKKKAPEGLKISSTRRFFSSSSNAAPKSAELPPRSKTPDLTAFFNKEPKSAGLPPRSKTPDPYGTPSPNATSSIGRARFNSLDSGALLSASATPHAPSSPTTTTRALGSTDLLRPGQGTRYANDPKLRPFYSPTAESFPADVHAGMPPTPANTVRGMPDNSTEMRFSEEYDNNFTVKDKAGKKEKKRPGMEHNPFSEQFGVAKSIGATVNAATAVASRSGTPTPMPMPSVASRSGTPTPLAINNSRAGTPTTVDGFLAVPRSAGTNSPAPTLPDGHTNVSAGAGGGSIALRAMRGMKSLARMGSKGNLLDVFEDPNAPASSASAAAATKDKKKSKIKVKAKSNAKDKDKENGKPPKSSTSSFEVGSASPVRLKVEKKRSILGIGLGLPGKLSVGRARGSSVNSTGAKDSWMGERKDENAVRREEREGKENKKDRLSVDSAYLLQTREMAASRPGSALSVYSSVSNTHANPNVNVKRESASTTSSGYSSLRPNSATSSVLSAVSYGHVLGTATATSAAANIGVGGEGKRASRASKASSSGGVGYSYSASLGHGQGQDAIASSHDQPVVVPVPEQAGGEVLVERKASSSGSSVRWDEVGLERQKTERAASRRGSVDSAHVLATTTSAAHSAHNEGSKRESRHSIEGRRRTRISDVFPESVSGSGEGDSGEDIERRMSLESGRSSGSGSSGGRYPMLMLEEATSDGHGGSEYRYRDRSLERGEDEVRARSRSRPMTELEKERPRGGVYDSEGGVGTGAVLSMLDRATADLEKFIGDLEATPGASEAGSVANSPALKRLAQSHETGDGSPKPAAKSKVAGPVKRGSVERTVRRIESLSSSGSVSNLKNALVNASANGKQKTLLKKKSSTISISSLRPYAQSRKLSGGDKDAADKATTNKAKAHVIGQNIAPWSQLTLSPLKETSFSSSVSAALEDKDKNGRKSSTPKNQNHAHAPSSSGEYTPGPMPDPPVVFQPLKPSKSRVVLGVSRARVAREEEIMKDELGREEAAKGVARSSMVTFGHRSESSSESAAGGGAARERERVFRPPTEVEKAEREREKRASLLLPLQMGNLEDTRRSSVSASESNTGTVRLAPGAKRVLGMNGTLGGSDVSNAEAEADDSPDSDIPDELQVILSGGSDEERSPDPTMSFQPASPPLPSPGLPPSESPPKLPQLRLVPTSYTEDGLGTSSLTPSTDDEGNTKRSFDFTGELRKLNESGGSDRKSFVEQLENAFKTPAKVDLRGGFEIGLDALVVPPVPKIPVDFSYAAVTDSSDSSGSSGQSLGVLPTKEEMDKMVQAKEPSLLPGSDSLAHSDEGVSTVDAKAELREKISVESNSSAGRLNQSFRFGNAGTPQEQSPVSVVPPARPQAPTPSQRPRHAPSMSLGDDESVLKSIYAKANRPGHRPRANSDASIHSSIHRLSRDFSQHHEGLSGIVTSTKSRPNSTISFTGLDSFDEVRRGFEFTEDRPMFYPPPAQVQVQSGRVRHARDASLFSIASVSSFGDVVDNGTADPFDYACLPTLRERPSSENMSTMSSNIDDTFSFVRHQPRRKRVDSDSSSFYFKAPGNTSRGHHRRNESNMSVVSQGPPISMYNRSYGRHGHSKNDSFASASSSSIAHSYAHHGANAGRTAWARHHPRDASVDSVGSEFSVSRLGRPGLGDKMFDNHPAPLTAISASPVESSYSRSDIMNHRSSYDFDSIMDAGRTTSLEDSLFEKTGSRSDGSSDESVFGYDGSHPSQRLRIPQNHFRPVSVYSFSSELSPMKEDETMISMLGGGHVRRQSMASIVNSSPCVRKEKRKYNTASDNFDDYAQQIGGPQIVEKPSIASTASVQFGGDRMIKAKRGLLERQSLEESALMAEGEDTSLAYIPMPVFTRASLSNRSRSSTVTTSSSSECPTPPLSSSDGTTSEGSQSSIDLSQINFALSSSDHPPPSFARRTRAPGQGHRRRYSQARASRSSVYETIEEERFAMPSPALSKKSSPTVHQPIFVVNPDRSSMGSAHGSSLWEDEEGFLALRRYYALRDEAQDTVAESRRVWLDTPFSVFALQTFQPPKHPDGMQAMLQESVVNYRSLPSELHPRRTRSRTSSRASPYPKSPRRIQPITSHESYLDNNSLSLGTALRQIPVNYNLTSPIPALDALKPFSPLAMDMDKSNSFGNLPVDVRPRVGSTARRAALGWTKRSTKSSNGQKENASISAMATPGAALRIKRPAPASRRRPTRAAKA